VIGECSDDKLKYYNLFIIALLTSNSRTMRTVFVFGIRYPAESGHQLSGIRSKLLSGTSLLFSHELVSGHQYVHRQ